MTEYLLAIENLKTYFYTREGVVPAVDGVNLTIKPGGTLALVGESGCGKRVTALSNMRLMPRPTVKPLLSAAGRSVKRSSSTRV